MSFKVGEAVQARYDGGNWFCGAIERVRADGSYDVVFDDGDRESAIAREHVRRSSTVCLSRKRKFDEADALVGRDIAVPLDYFGQAPKRRRPVPAKVTKVVSIKNQFYNGKGVEVKLKRAVLERQVWWLPLLHARSFLQNNKNCAVCGNGVVEGDANMMLMCDGCPASFHLSCIGLDAVPEDDQWFCDAPRCGGAKLCRRVPNRKHCAVNDKNDIDQCRRVPNSEHCAVCGKDDMDDTLLMCDGCPASFHLSCIGLDVVPEDDQWFCDAPKCGGAKLCRVSAEDRAAQQKAMANLEHRVRLAVREIQHRDQEAMRNVRFWQKVAQVVAEPELDASRCQQLWFGECCDTGASRSKAKDSSMAKAKSQDTPRSPCDSDQTAAPMASTACNKSAASTAACAPAVRDDENNGNAEAMPPPACLPRKTPVPQKVPGKGTMKYRAFVRDICEKQEHGHCDIVKVVETPDQLMLDSPLLDDSPICFGGFGGEGGGAVTSDDKPALADLTNYDVDYADKAKAGVTPKSMSLNDHDRYMVEWERGKKKSQAVRMMEQKLAWQKQYKKDRWNATPKRPYTKGPSTLSTTRSTMASNIANASSDNITAQVRVGGHVMKATMGCSGIVHFSGNLSDGNASDDDNSEVDEADISICTEEAEALQIEKLR